jgi:hypothetical protein
MHSRAIMSYARVAPHAQKGNAFRIKECEINPDFDRQGSPSVPTAPRPIALFRALWPRPLTRLSRDATSML